MSPRDLIGIVEAAYRVDLDDVAWMREVTEAAAPLLDEGLGVAGYCIDTTGHGPATHSPVFVGARDPWGGAWQTAWWEPRVARMPVRLVAELAAFGSPTYASHSCGAIVRGGVVARLAKGIPAMPLPDGVREAFIVSGLDTAGAGAVLFAFRAVQAVHPQQPAHAAQWARIAAHLTAAVRLRHRHGRVSRDVQMSRAVLRAAGRAVDAVRTRRGRAAPDALSSWPALHRGGFSVVPQQMGGYAGVENAPATLALAGLTTRENAVVALISLGRSNKAAAYELGIAPSTVSTLLTSAARKLGVIGARGVIERARTAVHSAGRARAIAVEADLTEAEAVVLALLLAGLSDRDVVALRGATRGTVTKQIDAVYGKLGVGSRRELQARASSFAPWNRLASRATPGARGEEHDLPRRVP